MAVLALFSWGYGIIRLTMAGQEHLRGQQPDDKHQEPELPRAEVGQHALQFLDKFVVAINRTPEFSQKLQEVDFTKTQRAEMWHTGKFWEIDYERGDYSCVIKYDSRFGRVLEIDKTAIKPELDLFHEKILVDAQVSPEFPQLGMGIVLDSRVYRNRPSEMFTNTLTANERVRGFLAASFDNSQVQTPPQQ